MFAKKQEIDYGGQRGKCQICSQLPRPLGLLETLVQQMPKTIKHKYTVINVSNLIYLNSFTMLSHTPTKLSLIKKLRRLKTFTNHFNLRYTQNLTNMTIVSAMCHLS